MALEKKVFAGGGMDTDTDERFVAKNDYKKKEKFCTCQH